MSWYEVFGWLTTFCFNVSYVPQIWKIYKTKRAKDLSVGYLWFLMAAYACGTIYSVSIHAWPIVFSHAIGATFLSILITFYFKYNKRGKHVQNNRRHR